MTPSEPTPPEASSAPADLGRLRIERGREDRARVRGVPWIRLALLAGVAAALFLLREPLLALFDGARGAAVDTARAERVVPGQAQAGDVSGNGYVVADVQASLSTVLSGRLVELDAKEGDTVQEGQVVARIQFDDYEIQLHQAEAATASATARREQATAQTASAGARAAEAQRDVEASRLTLRQLAAERDAQAEVVSSAGETHDRLRREVERNRKLYADHLIDAGEWDRVQTAARTAENDLAAARQRLAALQAGHDAYAAQITRKEAAAATAQQDVEVARRAEAVAQAAEAEAREARRLADVLLEKTRVRAPFTGLVIRKDAEVGEVLAPMGAGNSRGSVLTIVDPRSFEVQVELSERRIAQVHEGDRAVVFLDADPERGLAARVRKIWPRADRSKGTIELRVGLDERPPLLRPEMAARVVFKGGGEAAPVEAPYVSVPAAAVARRAARTLVFVVEGDRVRAADVTLGETRGGGVVVEQGLEGGERVVLHPGAGLEDGDRVRTGGDA